MPVRTDLNATRKEKLKSEVPSLKLDPGGRPSDMHRHCRRPKSA